ncbi:hypothetical protein ScPMuIL_000926 [Solemya velum]
MKNLLAHDESPEYDSQEITLLLFGCKGLDSMPATACMSLTTAGVVNNNPERLIEEEDKYETTAAQLTEPNFVEMADFQLFSYPAPLGHSVKNQVFDGYGSHGHIHIQEPVEKLFAGQTVPYPDSLPQIHAIHPTIPLNSAPEKVGYPFRDRVLEEPTRQNQCVTEFVRKLKYYYRSIKKKGSVKAREFSNIRRLLDKGNNDVSSDSLPKWFSYLLELYSQISEVESLAKVNSLYNGGCVAHLRGPETATDILISSAGPSLEKLRIAAVHLESGILQTTSEKCVTVGESEGIYQVSAQCLNGQGYVGARTLYGCHLYRISEPQSGEGDLRDGQMDMSCIASTSFENEHPSAFSLSPYIDTESLVATDSGNVYLWHADRKEMVVKEIHHRFACSQTWRGVHYGAHPRELVMADNTVVRIMDLRSATVKDVDLFALPNKLMYPTELIRGIEPHPACDFQHFITTDHSVLLTDERFPGHPLLYRPHMLRSPPQYLSTVMPPTGNNHHVLFLASQYPPETCCLWTLSDRGKPPQAVGPPWRVSRVDDITKYKEMNTVSDMLLFKERFAVSLSGITAFPHSSGFTVIQMDSYGEIFYQSYYQDTKESERTYSAGPGSSELVLDRKAVHVGQNWLEALKKQVDEVCSNTFYKTKMKDLQSSYDEVIIEKPAHVLCRLCMPQHSGYYNLEEEADVNAEDLCHSCNHRLARGSTIANSSEQDGITCLSDSLYPLFDLLPSVPESPGDPTSQLLLKLWEGETDLKDLLKRREEEQITMNSQMKATKPEPKHFWSDDSVDDQSQSEETDTKISKLETTVPDHADSTSVISGSLTNESLLRGRPRTTKYHRSMGWRKSQEQEIGSVMKSQANKSGDISSKAWSGSSQDKSFRNLRRSPRFSLKHVEEMENTQILKDNCTPVQSCENSPRDEHNTVKHSMRKDRKNIFPSPHLEKSPLKRSEETAKLLKHRAKSQNSESGDESDFNMSGIEQLVDDLPKHPTSVNVESNLKSVVTERRTNEELKSEFVDTEDDIEDEFLSKDKHKDFALFLPKLHHSSPNKIGDGASKVASPIKRAKSAAKIINFDIENTIEDEFFK